MLKRLHCRLPRRLAAFTTLLPTCVPPAEAWRTQAFATAGIYVTLVSQSLTHLSLNCCAGFVQSSGKPSGAATENKIGATTR
jgi:hypothetical protein